MAFLHEVLHNMYYSEVDNVVHQIVRLVYVPASKKINAHAKKSKWWDSKNYIKHRDWLWGKTSFLEENCPIACRLYSVIFELSQHPCCKICKKPVYFSGIKPPPELCAQHSRTSEQVKNRRRSTMINRYGVENYSSLDECRTKVKRTVTRNWGVDNVAKHSAVKQKIIDTNLQRYGVENYSQSSKFDQKFKNTVRDRYGANHPMHLEHIKQKVKNTCLEKYGVDNASKHSPFSRKINVKNFSNELKQILNHAHCDQLLMQKWNTHGWLWFKQQGVSDTWIYQRLSKLGVIFSGNSNRSEQLIIDLLNQKNINYRLHDRTLLKSNPGATELDFYLPDHNVAVEVNGLYWHCESMGKDSKYHLLKTQHCEQQGVQLIHITDAQLNTKWRIVESRLKHLLGYSNKIYARNTQVTIISASEKKEFFSDNHIQGDCASSVNLGLMKNGNLVAAMSLGKARFNRSHEWELLRYCCSINHTVIGGASKLFSAFRKIHKPLSVVSYSDRCWSTVLKNTVYGTMGFDLKGTSKPNYWYTKDYRNLHSRVAFQKHKLEEKLENFSPDISEWKNMQQNGWDRYWDVGNHVWSWNAT